MSYTYPFIYEVEDDKSGFLKKGMRIRNHYIKWIASNDFKNVENAIPAICLFVGWSWKKIFGERPLDLDVLDPIAYLIIDKFIEQTLPIDYSLAHWLRVLARRNIVRTAFKTTIPTVGDKSIRAFQYRPFEVPSDVEHRIFVEEMKEIVLNHVANNTRLSKVERKACRYIADVLMQEKLPSPLVLLNKFNIPYRQQEFYLDFTRITVRKHLYKIRKDIPYIYGNEEEVFIAKVNGDYEYSEEEDQEDSPIYDF